MAEPTRISQEKITPEIAGKLGYVVLPDSNRNAFYLEEWSDGSQRFRNIYLSKDYKMVDDEGLHKLDNEAVNLIRAEQEKLREAEAALPKA